MSPVIARIIRLPPVHFLVFLIGGAALQALYPMSIGLPSFQVAMVTGSIMLATAVAMGWAALFELKKHRTTVEPWRRPTALVTSGIFSFSRNPLYLTLTLVLVAIAVMADSAWLLIFAALLGLSLDRFIVRAEERFLDEALAEEYFAYKRQVRRWL